MSIRPLPVLISEELFLQQNKKLKTFLKGVSKSSEQQTQPTTIIRIQRMRFYVASVSASTEFARTDLLVATTLLWHVS